MNITPAGFMAPALPMSGPMELPPSIPLMKRYESIEMPTDLRDDLARLERGEFTGDVNKLLTQFSMQMQELSRGVTSTMTAFPVRENLEAEVKILVPMETPLRNRIPRVMGAGRAVAWKQISTLGGGWGSGVDQPGGGAAAQVFFGESGAPAELTTTYVDRTASYKLMGQRGNVTGFAMASGANFQNQYVVERRNAILNTMLNEENALINGDATSVSAPWGDGTSPLAFDGLIRLVATGNGTPAASIQTGVGALTFAHIDQQLRRVWNQGGRSPYILCNAQEQNSIKNIALASTSVHRVILSDQQGAVASVRVVGYVHPITGEVVPILASRFVPAGTIIFGADNGPNGDPALEVEVLPQVQLPQLAPNDNVQGYTAQEIAPAYATPQVYGFLVSVYEVLKMKIGTVFAKSTGVTAV
jgi:hypothetical protein